MNVLVVDTIARGHALAWKLAQSPDCNHLWMAPGNTGSEDVAESTGIQPLETDKLVEFAKQNVDLTVVGADEPLATGLVDALEQEGLAAFGPSQGSAEIEWSKVFAKNLAARRGIPTARFGIMSELNQALYYSACQEFPLFVKQDKLYGGKGVTKCDSVVAVEDVLHGLRSINRFGLNNKVVIESGLVGPEISLHAWCDGETYRMFPFAMQDHKTIYESDRGPMTGGMGVIAPVPGITPEDVEQLGCQFVAPVLRALKETGRPFKGILYPGLILTAEGPKLLEYNARPGGPETEAWVPRLKTDLLKVMMACVNGELTTLSEIKWRRAATACIVLAAGGYPDQSRANAVINGLELLLDRPDLEVFHYATRELGRQPVVNSGRVLSRCS